SGQATHIVAEPQRNTSAIISSLYCNTQGVGVLRRTHDLVRQGLVTEPLGKRLPAELDLVTLQKAYVRWAPVYDLVFGALFTRGRRAAIAAAEQVGGRILEVGVGTGISLPGYSRHNRIVGIDLSAAMLCHAQRRVTNLRLSNVEKLEVMDAEH